MNRTKEMVFSYSLLLLLGLCLYRWASTPKTASAYSGGPPASRTGAPGEGTCHDCHNSYDINDPSGSVTVDGLPGSYVAGGDPIPFTVTVSQDGTNGANIDWGFQITVLDAHDLFAGTLVVADTTNTQIDSAVVKRRTRFYIEQTLAGTFFNPDGAPGATWNVTWVPPDKDVGPVTFYLAGNAGNGDHFRTGDYVFVNSQTVLGPGSNFIAYTLPLSGRSYSSRAAWKPRSVLLSSHHAWLVLAPRESAALRPQK